MTSRVLPLSAALLALPFAGCLGEPDGFAITQALFPLEGPCPTSATQDVEFAGEVDGLRVRITGPGIEEPIESEGSVGELTIEDVPAGEARQIVLFGLDTSGAAAWRGVAKDVTVAADAATSVDVLLSRVADLSCTRVPQGEPRAFHTATRLNDGRVLLVGGARANADGSAICGDGCRSLDATSSAEIYDPTTGRFETVGSLAVPRMFHQATLLDDGRVAISGGTSEALAVPVDAANPFPFKPRLAAVSLIEVFDPSSGDFSVSVDDPNGPRLFHATTTTQEGWLLLSGGIPNQQAVNDLSNAVSDSTLCDAELNCVAGPNMQRRRAGHSLHRLDTGDVVAWGGSVELGTAAGLPGYKPEILRAGGDAFEIVDTAGFASNAFNLFFAATTQYVDFRVLAAGGLIRDDAGSFSLSSRDIGGTLRGSVYIFDGKQGAAGALSAGPYDAGGTLQPLVTTTPTFLGSAAPLPGGTRAAIAGGFSSLDLTPSAALDLYSEDPFTVQPLNIGGVPRALREARGGLSASGIGDGTVLFSGGESPDGAGGRTPKNTSEIFADPQDPGDT